MRFSVNGKYVQPLGRPRKYEVVKENTNNYLLDTGNNKEWFPKIVCKPVYWCVDCKYLDGTYCQLRDIERPYEYNASCELLELKNIEPEMTKPKSWNPDHFGEILFECDPDGQLTIFREAVDEPPEPDDYPCFEAYEDAWQEWEVREQQRKESKVREQEVREQKVREQKVREQKVREQEVREQEVREQEDSDRRLKCSLTPPQKIINKANSKGIKGTFDLKEIKNNLYWYIRYREDGRLKSVYLGRAQPKVREQKN